MKEGEDGMFNKVFIALTVVAVLAFTAAAPASTMNVNLVNNPGFETEDTEEKDAANWGQGDFSAMYRTDTQKYTGSWSMAIDADGTTTREISSQGISVESEDAGKTFNASVWVYSAGIDTGHADLKVAFRNSDGLVAAFSTLVLHESSTTGTWTQGTISDTIPSGSETINYQLLFGGRPNSNVDGKVYYDDASFVIVPEPATLALIGIGGIGVLLRRRRA